MNGAHALLRTLVEAGVDVCFMNPGTSEMHFVAALDGVPEMRGVLALFEGVATGAADGYGRMSGRPAAVLLHLGAGLGNGIANLHNARKAHTPVVVVVGDHATYHVLFDAPLQSDIETLARNVSTFVRSSPSPTTVGEDAVEAIVAARRGEVATLVLPADSSWGEPAAPASIPDAAAVAGIDGDAVDDVVAALSSGETAALLVGGAACTGEPLRLAAAVAAATGAKLLCETFPARLERGAGVPPVERLAYLGEMAAMQLDGLHHLVLVGAKSPVSFFAYPDKPSDLVPVGCRVHRLELPGPLAGATLAALAARLGVSADDAPLAPLSRPDLPSGPLTAVSLAAAVGALLPENAIVSDEANTSGVALPASTAGSPRHDWLCLTGGAIGHGLPTAVGAAVACPDRKVVALQADGSAMYTVQSWWTMVRENLDVVTVILNNGSYAVLNMELSRVGAEAGGPRSRSMLSLQDPSLDFVALATGQGVPATRATTVDEFVEQFREALATRGPRVIEAIVGR